MYYKTAPIRFLLLIKKNICQKYVQPHNVSHVFINGYFSVGGDITDKLLWTYYWTPGFTVKEAVFVWKVKPVNTNTQVHTLVLQRTEWFHLFKESLWLDCGAAYGQA